MSLSVKRCGRKGSHFFWGEGNLGPRTPRDGGVANGPETPNFVALRWVQAQVRVPIDFGEKSVFKWNVTKVVAATVFRFSRYSVRVGEIRSRLHVDGASVRHDRRTVRLRRGRPGAFSERQNSVGSRR